MNNKSSYQLYIFCDGGARGNPGPAAIGFVVKDSDNKVLFEQGVYIGKATNNVAEYTAVIKALEWLSSEITNFQFSVFKINFYLDSKLVVNQLNGLFKIKNSSLRDLIIKARQLEREINLPIIYNHVPREKNKRADLLLNQALDKL
jgi:ribonuclease HI